MTNSNRHSIKTRAKLLLAGFLIAGLIVVAAQDLAPNMSHAKLIAYIFLGLAAVAVNLVGLSMIYLNVYQWVLRKGGTDTAWFWFNSEPKDLISLREKLSKYLFSQLFNRVWGRQGCPLKGQAMRTNR